MPLTFPANPTGPASANRFFRLFYDWSRVSSSSHGSIENSLPLVRSHRQRCRLYPGIQLGTRRVYGICRDAATKGQVVCGVGVALGGRRAQSHMDGMSVGSTRARKDRRNYSRSSASLSTTQNVSHTKPTSTPGTNTKARLDTKPPADLSTPLRALLRLLPHPITIITTSHPTADPTIAPPFETTFRGMTVSSFTSLTLHPTPHITFNIKLPSSTYAGLSLSGTFLAHVLSSTPSAARISDVFAKGGGKGAGVFWELVRGGEIGIKEGDVKIFVDPLTNAPVITGSGTDIKESPVLQVLRCRHIPEKEVHVGDHVIVVAEVIGMLDVSSSGSLAAPESGNRLGLLYVDGGYRYVGGAVVLDKEDEVNSERLPAGKKLPDYIQREAKPVFQTFGMNVRRGDEGMGTG